ncbi:MAG TPA: sugar ABC transporter ATP-binding protein [Candidatus Limnocylindrales bacterium]|nr:sugar ABC transporter ATP-binding protein [Candidatus Limnocylindrales bacterium]
MTEILLEATGVEKRYGAVTALRDASLSVRPGEIHALMGANGAGKSTLVKVLTGAVKPDAGTIRLRGQDRAVHSPAEARRTGMVSVYQEPAIIPDLTIAENLVLTETPIDPFRERIADLGLPGLDLRAPARDLPLATLRVVDLARALAIEPDVLLLDEMTAALPADLTARVLEVVASQRGTSRSVIFISHRMLEVAGLCDRATVLREGSTVGVVEIAPGSGAEEEIVTLMLGPAVGSAELARPAVAASAAPTPDAVPQLSARSLGAARNLHDVSFDVHAGEVLGVVALEGQGQDELFDILSGQTRPGTGEMLVDGSSVSLRHPADAIRAGIVLVPGDRSSALLMQRSVRENIALPGIAAARRWGLVNARAESRRVTAAIERLQIDTRAQSEARRLSGGNQQKVTIARWLESGVRTFLFYDPTRGIDIGTKREIYELVRELAAAGAAVLLLTSELDEIQRVCDRAIVIFGGRVVDELPASRADEPTLLRSAHGLPVTAGAA